MANQSRRCRNSLGSTLFTILGEKRAITLETSLLQLYQWALESGTLRELPPKTGRWKLDMVVYDGAGTSPHHQQPWALVELKQGYIDADLLENRRADREKLLSVSKWYPGAHPYLICGGVVNVGRREYHKAKAQKLGDQWFEAETGDLPHDNGNWWFCARVLPRSEPG